jgi:dTDP-4-dehydrorhamnose reductase
MVNAAAYTAVDRAEMEHDQAFRINGHSLEILAEEARTLHAGIVHFSTDYVFSGDKGTPYLEGDPVAPLGVYGASKQLGEQLLQDSGIPQLIFRTSWVYGLRGQNFLLTMLRLMQERESLGIVNDQIGAPTWSRMIAEATALAIAQCTKGEVFNPEEQSGVYHLTAGGETSWFGFAERIQSLAKAQGLMKGPIATLRPIPSSDYPTPAKRPLYSVLSNQKISTAFQIELPHWTRSLDQCLGN